MKISRRSIIIIGLCLVLIIIGLQFLDSNLILLYSKNNKNFPLEEKWSLDLPENVQAISDSSDYLVIVRGTYTIFAIDVRNGTVIWKFRLNQQVYKQPAIIYNGKVFIADSTTVYAIDEETGTTLWRQPLTEKSGGWVVTASDDLVIVNQYSTDIRAYKSNNGIFLWRVGASRGGTEAYIVDDTVLVLTYGEKFYDITTGELKREIGTDYKDFFVLIGDNYYYSLDNKIIATNLSTQAILWTRIIPLERPRGIYGNKEFLFIITSNYIYCIKQESGGIIWRKDASSPTNMSIIGNTLYYRELFRNRIGTVDIQTGEDLGSLVYNLPRLMTQINDEMVAADNMLIFSSHNKLYGFGPKENP